MKLFRVLQGHGKSSCLDLMEAAIWGRGQLKEETCWMGTLVRVPHTASHRLLLQVGKDPPIPWML